MTMTDTRPTIADRAEQFGLTLTVLDGPHRRLSDAFERRPWAHFAFRVQLTAPNGASIVTDYRTGEGNGDAAPDAAEILRCLALDASTYDEARDAAEFVHTFGDTSTEENTRASLASYEACGQTFRELAELLGEDGRAALLYETEQE